MQHKASISSQGKGSQPKGNKASVGSGDFDDDSSLSGSSSLGSSSMRTAHHRLLKFSRLLRHRPRVNSRPSWALCYCRRALMAKHA